MNAFGHISISRHARNSPAIRGVAVRCLIAVVTAVILASCSSYEDNEVPNGELAEDIRRADSLVTAHDFPEAMRALKAFSSVQNPPTTDTALLVKAYSLMAEIHSKYEDYSSQQRRFLDLRHDRKQTSIQRPRQSQMAVAVRKILRFRDTAGCRIRPRNKNIPHSGATQRCQQ